MIYTFVFTIICFLLTCLGAGVVFVVGKPSIKLISFLNSFASGVMISASIFSLIIPSIEYCEQLGLTSWIILPVCFIFALLLVLFLNRTTYKQSNDINLKSLIIGITLHNIPEGMCIGFAFASASIIGTSNALYLAIMIAVGIGIQNAPEGSGLSFPLYANGYSKSKAFIISSLVGFVEVPASLIAYVLGHNFLVVLPFMLSFSACIMISVAVLDIMPESCLKDKKISTLGFFFGFILMMLFDLAL